MLGTPLRRRLFVLTAAGILPLGFMAGVGLSVLVQQQRAQAERVALELARSIATAVDAELRSSILVLEVLATTPKLDTDDLPEFRERAQRVLALERDWVAITLADPTGRLVVHTRFSPEALPPTVSDEESFRLVVRSSRRGGCFSR